MHVELIYLTFHGHDSLLSLVAYRLGEECHVECRCGL